MHGSAPTGLPMSLVDDDTIEREITGSRLVLAMMDRASWEFTDLRTRMQMLEGQDDLATTDLLRAQVVARLVLESWTKVGLTGTVWQLLHPSCTRNLPSCRSRPITTATIGWWRRR